jgi:hypothetical protein
MNSIAKTEIDQQPMNELKGEGATYSSLNGIIGCHRSELYVTQDKESDRKKKAIKFKPKKNRTYSYVLER